MVDGDDSTRGWERMAGDRGGWRRLNERVGENGRRSWWMEMTQREGGREWQEIVVDGDDSTRGWERMAGDRGGWR